MMREVKILKNKKLYEGALEVLRIGNEAVLKAKEENKKFGIPEFFYKNGVIYYELESGELTTIKPKILQDS